MSIRGDILYGTRIIVLLGVTETNRNIPPSAANFFVQSSKSMKQTPLHRQCRSCSYNPVQRRSDRGMSNNGTDDRQRPQE
ncbi:hypothetical protein G7K_4580-t1 [Saitoella complicata NRRL Y-17804]|uniref:Uncharacterized protein n=1 Tax=Saitoella complicata (strain BCRC 22490 / CBS 7301 / JCM 7358 / NBRC 10748 / NRRL Y-17804) TaxID=698492 RepID=A0A0E9NLA8_SAICN|nr:hypothetical protein G7K_4580-t1 [Saitoella complicata NRRL Y-17804]